jgi:hypothetical protein
MPVTVVGYREADWVELHPEKIGENETIRRIQKKFIGLESITHESYASDSQKDPSFSD